MTKRTWNPKKKKRMRKHGFLKRLSTMAGKALLKRRRSKGRKVLTVQKKVK
ncbi:MAG: 50S ribosomal protein L34 [Pseudomonadales bacterium]|nr:50S ribosomal protein L34 [Candidatus Woesebacteria bacterium]MCB9801401.1 50S ribosomal protein L34 [Pseudomonadales bacterium]